MHDSYLAGLIDSQGTITLLKQGKNRVRRIYVSVSVDDPAIIASIAENYPGYTRVQPGKIRRTAYIWIVEGNDALEVLEKVSPYLQIWRRKYAARRLLNDFPREWFYGKTEQARKRRLEVDSLFRQISKRTKTRSDMTPQKIELPWEYKKREPWALSYIAGLLDGEGWISDKWRAQGAVVEIWSTDPEVVQWSQNRFGGYITMRPATAARKKIWAWRNSGHKAIHLLKEIEPIMLHTDKKNRVKTLSEQVKPKKPERFEDLDLSGML